MLRSVSLLVVIGSVRLAGCGRTNHENQWETSTGSPQPGAQAAAYRPPSAQSGAGDRTNHENQWETSTGSPQPGAQAAAYRPPSAQSGAGDRNETKVRGCLSGANEL